MATKGHKRNTRFAFCVLTSLLAGFLGFLLSHDSPVHAFSAGPPAGYTGAPQEEPEACAECHVPPDAGTGKISISAPQTYVPGQTYPITVTHQNIDPTRLRWGFQLTVLDTASDEKAGELQSVNGLTQVLNNAGPGSARQYIEHTSAGTFVGQQMARVGRSTGPRLRRMLVQSLSMQPAIMPTTTATRQATTSTARSSFQRPHRARRIFRSASVLRREALCRAATQLTS